MRLQHSGWWYVALSADRRVKARGNKVFEKVQIGKGPRIGEDLGVWIHVESKSKMKEYPYCHNFPHCVTHLNSISWGCAVKS